MAENIIPNGPAPSPEHPLLISVDGDLEAVDFIRRLHRGGLELRRADYGTAVIVIAERPPQPERGVRVELWQASGICHAVRCALSSGIEFDETELQCALEAAGRIIDDAAGALEGTSNA